MRRRCGVLRLTRLLVMICIALPVSAGTWTRTFEGPDFGALFDMVPLPGGEVLAVGATNHRHVPPFSGDALLIRLTREGDVVWERTWGGSGYEQAWAVAPVESGGVFVFGETDSFGAGDRDFFLLRLSEDGSEEWFRTYGGPRREWPYGMLRLSNGDLLLYGLTTHDSGARRQYAIRTTPSGDAVWEYIAGEAREELVLDAIEGPDGDLILCVGIDEDAGLVQLGPDGEVRWAKRYALPGWQFASCVAPAGEGEYLLAGFSMRERPRRQADTWLARTAANGDLLWETSFGADASDDYAQSLLPLGDGTYLIGGLGGGMPISVVDGAGNVRWSRRLAGPSVHGAEAMIELGGGGVLVAGFVQILNGRSYDAILVRTELDGGEE